MRWADVRGFGQMSDAAFSLFLQGLSYMAFYQTHGVLTRAALAWCYRHGALSFAAHQEAVAELIVRGVWLETGAGVYVSDWAWWLDELTREAGGEAAP